MKMHEFLERNASRAPHKTFLFSESRSITNMQAYRQVEKAAAALSPLGVKKGERVLIFAPKSIEYVLAMFAPFKLGAIAALIDVLDPQSYGRNVRSLSPKLVISTSRCLNELRDASSKTTPDSGRLSR